MKRQEIDLREKIAAEIEAAIKDGDGKWAMLRAIGIIRAPLNHNSICPCSICNKWNIKSCSDDCSQHRRISLSEAIRLAQVQGVEIQDEFECGWCHTGQNSWKITELLFDAENEFPITPCCHTEATEALTFPDEEEDSTRKDDEASYRYSVTGR